MIDQPANTPRARRGVLAAVLDPSTPALKPPPDHNPATGELNPQSPISHLPSPMTHTAIKPRAGFEPGAATAPSRETSPFEPLPGIHSLAEAEPQRSEIRAAEVSPLAPAPSPSITFSITPTLDAAPHAGAVLDHLRAHLALLGVQAKITFHF